MNLQVIKYKFVKTMLHLSLNHLSKFRRCDRLLQEYHHSFSATTVSYFSAAQPKPHFPDLPSIITPKASPLEPRLSSSERAVFLSFRGKDTRQGFVKSLHEALGFAGIPAFKDDVDLAKGDRIQQGLMDAIHHSWVFIPVISANYASSKWCLEELAEIMKSVKMENKTVFPVFYDVRPTDVRHLKPPFSAAFAQLEDCRKVKAWKRALSEVADFSGFDLIDTYQRDEAKCIEDIAGAVGKKVEAVKREKVEYHQAALNKLTIQNVIVPKQPNY